MAPTTINAAPAKNSAEKVFLRLEKVISKMLYWNKYKKQVYNVLSNWRPCIDTRLIYGAWISLILRSLKSQIRLSDLKVAMEPPFVRT